MGAIGPLIPKLGNLLVGEFNLEKRVRKGIESLVTELTLMHAALCKVAKVPPEQLDMGVKIWAGNVKELSYQMEDIVDTFMVFVEDGGEPANPKNRVKKLLKKVTKLLKKGRVLHRISDALEEAVGQAKQLAELRQRYEHAMGDSSVAASVDPRVMALYTDVAELVGIEDTRDELINMLIKDDDWLKHPLKTVSIVGFGGLGKTTLAKAAYDKVKVQFDCGAFVSVSQNPNMEKVLKDVLFELNKKKYAKIYNAARGEKQLIDELIEFLNDKRYLIVIDDIWDKKAWELIKCAFSKNNLGSRLITTTRIVSVSEACCSSSDDIYRMKPLSDDYSRRLFYKRIFSHEESCPPELVQVSQDILKKCDGIPLAIITISGLLTSNCQVKTKDQWYRLLNSIGRGLAEDRSVEEMKKILLYSYYDLPFYLKPCLLYLSIFPEDYKVRSCELIWRWIAEGFVYSERQETSLYELGEYYLNELINRSLIQLVGMNDKGGVTTCRVHDMVLDLLCSLSSEENFVTILDGTERKVPYLQGKVRRLSIQKSKVDAATISISQVRSLIDFTEDTINKVLLTSSFQVLRVLDLEDCTISDIGHFQNLVHLRYLGLKGTCVTELPMGIGKLRFLQTLDLRKTGIKQLPTSIVLLSHLMCLYVHRDIKLPSGMDKLTSLEVIEGPLIGKSHDIFNIDIVKELSYLTKLRVLRCTCKFMDDSLNKTLVESLGSLHKLECLNISGHYGPVHLVLEGWVPPPQLRVSYFSWLPTVPAWINPSSLPLISSLTLLVKKVRPEDIRLLGMLPALRYLRLMGDPTLPVSADTVETSVITADAFPCLTVCLFFRVAAVPSIFPRGAALKLKLLRFAFPVIRMARGNIDFGMGHLPSLEKVEVEILSVGGRCKMTEEVIAALRAAVADHPNHPAIRFS